MPQENNERIAVVEKAIEGIEKGVSRLEQKLDSLLDNIEKKFVPRHEYESAHNHIKGEIEELRDELKSMKERNLKIVGGLITAIVTLGAAVLQGLNLFK
jgi:chromosome segregation ATPase